MRKKKSRIGEGESTGSMGSRSKEKGKDSVKEEDHVRESQPDYKQTEDMYDSDWEDGFVPILTSASDDSPIDPIKGLTIEFSTPADSPTQKRIRRASAKDKELAELVHKTHLLCLIARGRLADRACDDPLLKASLLSLIPERLLEISKLSKIMAHDLAPIVRWFHDHFRTRIPTDEKKSLQSALLMALQTSEGTPEEITALSVALFRVLNLTTRFVSVLDVISLKPELNKLETENQEATRLGAGIFRSSTLMVNTSNNVCISPSQSSPANNNESIDGTSPGVPKRNLRPKSRQLKGSPSAPKSVKRKLEPQSCETQIDTSEAGDVVRSENIKRKGDLEFEMQLQMALSATSVEAGAKDVNSDIKVVDTDSSKVSTLKRIEGIQNDQSPTSTGRISTAYGSRKVGAPLYWAEVYCSGENQTGKWVHCDAINLIVNRAQNVEAEVAACRKSLRYAVAFGGNGAKDVTRRYCMKWYKIASERINPVWWSAVLAPLKDLESRATSGTANIEKQQNIASNGSHDVEASTSASRNSLEDMELETRALTEPLPTNQQAYKKHHLYAIERWLTRYEILHPRGPVLGFCAGHAVYPRDCVQTLKTKDRWLREALQVKVNELPVKVLKRPQKSKKVQVFEDYNSVELEPATETNISLYEKWQLEPLRLPHAVNGVVPKNERGQVDAWSAKCLPPGTVHLRLPRLVPIARMLGVDFAPAMVGFEFRNGQSLPVFDGIVVCTEFKDAILAVYAEQEERRMAEERKRKERDAISRWYQLLNSIVTRQRLNNSYGQASPSQIRDDIPMAADKTESSSSKEKACLNLRKTKLSASTTRVEEENHEHVFLSEDENYDEESSTRLKRCRCGFAVEVEEF